MENERRALSTPAGPSDPNVVRSEFSCVFDPVMTDKAGSDAIKEILRLANIECEKIKSFGDGGTAG